MGMVLKLSDREFDLLNTAVISQINHCQTMVDEFKAEKESPDCPEYKDCPLDPEEEWSGKKKEYEELHSRMKTQILKRAFEYFRDDRIRRFRELGNRARLYALHVDSCMKKAVSGVKKGE